MSAYSKEKKQHLILDEEGIVCSECGLDVFHCKCVKETRVKCNEKKS